MLKKEKMLEKDKRNLDKIRNKMMIKVKIIKNKLKVLKKEWLKLEPIKDKIIKNKLKVVKKELLSIDPIKDKIIKNKLKLLKKE